MSESMYLGVGATCTVLVRFLKPSKYIASVIINPPKGAKQEGLLVCRKGEIIIKKKSQEVIFFRHEKFDREVYCQKRYARVTHNGPLESRFAEKAQVRRAAVDDNCPEGMRALPNEALTGQWRKEDADKLRQEGFAVDDDNDPAEENDNPEHNRQLIADLGQEWGQVLQCERKKDGCNDSRPKINAFSSDVLQGISMIGMFFLFFPMKYLKSVVLVQTSKKMVAGGHRPLTLGELIKFLGIWLFLSSFKGSKRRDFWSTAPIDPHFGAPFRVHHWMSGRRFELILASLTYTDQDPPSYRDRFHYVRQLLQAFNDHMAEIFTPGWVSCLDESISIWLSKWTCPGWMFVPRKPHPFGNEYHTICDGLSGILFALEIVEGQDEPKEKPVSRTNRFGATTGLLLRLTRVLHQTGKVVILDSGFCVLKALVELKKVGVFASAVIKKRRYWPRYCAGGYIDYSVQKKKIPIGQVISLNGELEDVPYHIMVMHDVDWNMKLFTTYGCTTPLVDSPMKYRRLPEDNLTIQFQYTDTVYNHYRYRHAVDDHNNLRHSDISIEETWRTHRWENRSFAFIFAVAEVNTFLAFRFFVWANSDKRAPTMLEFRRMLAREMINNDYLLEDEHNGDTTPTKRASKRKKQDTEHTLETAPKNSRYWNGNRWILGAKQAYQQHKCKSCPVRVRTYCLCNVGLFLP